MTPAEQFTAWRDELTAERGTVLEQLEAARVTLHEAEARLQEEKQALVALDAFAQGCAGVAFEGAVLSLSAPLHSRLSHARQPLEDAEKARGAARSSVKAFEQRAAELADAIAQVDRALASAKVSQLRPPAVSTRPKPAPLDFDTIGAPARGRA